jgi:CheY-like chemotaxis protein
MTETPAILVVDDDADNRRIASAVLSAAGWRVDDVEDGASAIEAVRCGGYALVLLDIQMPGLDGYQTAAAMRAAGGVVPIMAFTALRHQDALDRARDVGMDGHIGKPFTPDMLIAAVKPWWPDLADHPATRLGAIFGEEEIAGLLSRLHEQLVEALAIDARDTALPARAHKLAGLAGTLGFADVSRHWLAVSEGDKSALPTARIATRRALHDLARFGPTSQDN